MSNEPTANEVAGIVCRSLVDVATHLRADAAALLIIQGPGNVAGTVYIPVGLNPTELDAWARKLASELRILADDVENGNTRRDLDEQADSYRKGNR